MIDEKALARAMEAYSPQPQGQPDPDRLRAAILAYESAKQKGEAEGWRGIESAPKDGAAFMLFIRDSVDGDHCFAPVSRTSDGKWWDDSTGDQIEPIAGATHWRPLPTPPSAMLSAAGERG